MRLNSSKINILLIILIFNLLGCKNKKLTIYSSLPRDQFNIPTDSLAKKYNINHLKVIQDYADSIEHRLMQSLKKNDDTPLLLITENWLFLEKLSRENQLVDLSTQPTFSKYLSDHKYFLPIASDQYSFFTSKSSANTEPIDLKTLLERHKGKIAIANPIYSPSLFISLLSLNLTQNEPTLDWLKSYQISIAQDESYLLTNIANSNCTLFLLKNSSSNKYKEQLSPIQFKQKNQYQFSIPYFIAILNKQTQHELDFSFDLLNTILSSDESLNPPQANPFKFNHSICAAGYNDCRSAFNKNFSEALWKPHIFNFNKSSNNYCLTPVPKALSVDSQR